MTAVFALALVVISDKPGASVIAVDAAIVVSVPIAVVSLTAWKSLSMHRCEKHNEQQQQQQQRRQQQQQQPARMLNVHDQVHIFLYVA